MLSCSCGARSTRSKDDCRSRAAGTESFRPFLVIFPRKESVPTTQLSKRNPQNNDNPFLPFFFSRDFGITFLPSSSFLCLPSFICRFYLTFFLPSFLLQAQAMVERTAEMER
jgi:hypothetical protein